MSKRLSLKAMQERLAQRLDEARDRGSTAVWLGLGLGEWRALVPLVHSGEILSWIWPHPVPYTQPWFRGVINHRGEVLGLVDLAGFLALQGTLPPPAPLTERLTPQTRLIGLQPALGTHAVLWVDRLLGLHGPSGFMRCAAPPDGAPAWWRQCLWDAQGREWQELDLVALAQMPAFLAVEAAGA